MEVTVVIKRYTKALMGEMWVENQKYGLWALSLVAALWIMVLLELNSGKAGGLFCIKKDPCGSILVNLSTP
jgi:hypothetical protein